MKTNSKALAPYCSIFSQSEPVMDDNQSPQGTYVGNTALYGTPFFLDTDALVNPHVSVIGMTGSGKTYMVKSIVTKLSIEKHYGILIIDWNSEYTDSVEFLCGKVWRVSSAEELPSADALFSGVNSIDLSYVETDAGKVGLAQAVLEKTRSFMLSIAPGTGTSRVLVIDEAWKLTDLERSLGRLFREGRKFGFMIVAATQLVNDVNNEVLANAACSFVFRLQGSQNLDGLVSSGLLEQEFVSHAKSLDRGGCIVSLIYRSGTAPKRFLIKRVHGFDFRVYTIRGNSMATNISMRKLQSVLDAMHFGNDASMQITKFFESNAKGVDLSQLVGFLFGIGLERPGIFAILRELGVNDRSIAVSIESLKGVEFVR